MKPEEIYVLVACERSGKVRSRLRAMGLNAWSCDLVAADDGSEFHIIGDAREIVKRGWHMLLAHPVCQFLTNAGARWLYTGGKKSNGVDLERWVNMEQGAADFKCYLKAHHIPLRAIENPKPHSYAIGAIGRPYDQSTQPWMFGDLRSKETCYWLEGLPLLEETNNVYAEMLLLPKSVSHACHYASPGEERSKVRSETYPGVADAMTQWGQYAIDFYKDK